MSSYLRNRDARCIQPAGRSLLADGCSSSEGWGRQLGEVHGVSDGTSAIRRYEENIRRQEATVRGQQELAASSLEAQFASLEDLGEQTEVETRLAALKSMDRKAIDY